MAEVGGELYKEPKGDVVSTLSIVFLLLDIIRIRFLPFNMGADKRGSPDRSLATQAGTHTYISFAYSEKGGVYMTMYYAPIDPHFKGVGTQAYLEHVERLQK